MGVNLWTATSEMQLSEKQRHLQAPSTSNQLNVSLVPP